MTAIPTAVSDREDALPLSSLPDAPGILLPPMDTLRVAVVGATGYGGAELVRLLANHPRAQVAVATSERLASSPLRKECPWLATDLVLQSFNSEGFDVDVVFLAQEAGFAMKHAPNLLKHSKVIDLSADFRLDDKELYSSTYKRTWESPGLSEKPVYGLSEIGLRDEIAKSRLVANPGCHATNAILGLAPLAKSQGLSGIPTVDSKSGVSGAGRSRQETDFLFSELSGSFKAYAVTGHRHIPEIEQWLATKVRFTPHLIPTARGIYTTIHAPLKPEVSPTTLAALYREAYEGLPFVRIIDTVPSTKQVLGSNRVDIHVDYDEHTQFAVISVVQDNLVKGAAGQAIQNMNLMAGLPEEMGLPLDGIWP